MLSDHTLSDLDTNEDLSSFSTSQSPEGDLHLRFFVEAGDEFAIPALGIREVLSLAPDQITPIPNVSPLLMGVLNFRGQVIWVSDIGQFLGGSRLLNTERAEISIIVIESQDILVGLAVERVKGMEWLRLDTLSPSTSHVSDGMSPFIKGEWQSVSSDQPLRLLDPLSILRSARWAA
ncbi:MAG: chemotaxis protein CheW [Thermosynechococcaceae cyanobacterium]